jgi:hypothetical protein
MEDEDAGVAVALAERRQPHHLGDELFARERSRA